MTLAERIAYETAIEDAIRAVSQNCPTATVDVFNAMRGLLPDRPSRIVYSPPVNYLEQLQRAAHQAWYDAHGHGLEIHGVAADAVAGLATPIGRLKAVIWRRKWAGKRGARLCWSTEYYLDDEPVTLDEIRKAGLAKGIRQRREEAGIVPRRKKRLSRAID